MYTNLYILYYSNMDPDLAPRNPERSEGFCIKFRMIRTNLD